MASTRADTYTCNTIAVQLFFGGSEIENSKRFIIKYSRITTTIMSNEQLCFTLYRHRCHCDERRTREIVTLFLAFFETETTKNSVKRRRFDGGPKKYFGLPVQRSYRKTIIMIYQHASFVLDISLARVNIFRITD